MVNATGFSARLKQLIEHLGMASAAFAQSIDVNRSSISHLLSGRNKPSLDVIVKILETYPEVNLYWLLNGKGEFLSKPTSLKDDRPAQTQNNPEKTVANITKQISNIDLEVEKIVVFYKNGSFKLYQNE
jgi:transcriptional regulator with XRE-family HTH domain